MTKEKKTLKALREELNIVDYKVGMIEGLASPVAIRDLKMFGKQISNALQPDMKVLLGTIEKELNKYGFSLGEIDSDGDWDDNGSEDFVLVKFPHGEEIKNIYLTLSWKRVAPDSYEYRSEKLEFSVDLTVNEIDPEDYETMLDSGEVEVNGDDSIDGDDVFGDDDTDVVKEESLAEWGDKIQYFKDGGLYFKVIHVAKSEKEANAYCEKNKGCSVIGQKPRWGTPKEVYIAKTSDNGKKDVDESVEYSTKAKDGLTFQVTKRDTTGMKGTQDKFSMALVDSNGKVKKDLGSHPSLEGAKKFGQKFTEEVLQEGVKTVKLSAKTLDSKEVKAEIKKHMPTAESYAKKHVAQIGYALYIKDADGKSLGHAFKENGGITLSIKQ